MLAAVAALAAVPGPLTGCGPNASDAASGTATRATQTPGPELSASTPAGRPTSPPWPAYPVDDYRYELRVVCFCEVRGIPVTITVQDGKVTDAVHATPGPGHSAGEQVSQRWLRITINDIINDANDPASAQVTVSWPLGQRHPTKVWIDRTTGGSDDEVGSTSGTSSQRRGTLPHHDPVAPSAAHHHIRSCREANARICTASTQCPGQGATAGGRGVAGGGGLEALRDQAW
jgi:hypothetical protein